MRTKESENAARCELAMEILNAVQGNNEDRMTVRDIIECQRALLDLLDCEPVLLQQAVPAIISSFIVGLPDLGYRIVKA